MGERRGTVRPRVPAATAGRIARACSHDKVLMAWYDTSGGSGGSTIGGGSASADARGAITMQRSVLGEAEEPGPCARNREELGRDGTQTGARGWVEQCDGTAALSSRGGAAVGARGLTASCCTDFLSVLYEQ